MATRNWLGILGLCIAVGVLAGCASATKEMAKTIAEKPPSTCQLPVIIVEGDTTRTQLVDATGPVCEQQLGEYVRAAKYSACAGFAAENEGTCLMAVSSESRGGSGGSGLSQDYQLLIATMKEDRADRRFYTGKAIDFATFSLDRHYDHRESEDFNGFLKELAKRRTGDMHFTKSDDGGGAGGGGRGGDGDFIVYTGDGNQGIHRSEGSAVSDGRNPTFMGINRPDSSFETSNNNQSAPGSEIQNAPAVSTSDDDGGQSIVPGF